MTEYVVPIVQRENLPRWHEYWDRMLPIERVKANQDASLSQVVTVNVSSQPSIFARESFSSSNEPKAGRM